MIDELTELGSYRLLRKLGAGAMGSVYLAEGDGGPVALKVVHPHLLERPDFFRRFYREAKVGRRVQHPNVVRTLDSDLQLVGAAAYGFLVMEYVQGRNLRSFLREYGQVPEGLLREVALQAAAGLEAIHAEGIVHRDIKPDNVLITDDHHVRIMDLGIAKLADESTALTAEGQFAGSVLYAAPEQILGETVGPATDLYALGVTLYELAAGRNPFERDDLAAIMRAHLEHVPERVHQAVPSISRWFSEVLSALMEKDPAERFVGAHELAGALEGGPRSAWWEARERKLLAEEEPVPDIFVARETAVVGRTGELGRLEAAWARAQDCEGTVLLLEGEAGVGKTRLIDAFLARQDTHRAHVLYGSFPPGGDVGGLADALDGRFGRAELANTLEPYLQTVAGLGPSFAALLHHEAPPTDAQALQGEALHAVFAALVRNLAAERPVLWVIDDLHFAPADMRAVVLSMARAVAGQPAMLIVTTRPGLPERELAHYARLPHAQHRKLERLSSDDVVAMLNDALKNQDLARRLGPRIATQSDGVPFFVLEMIRSLKEEELVREGPDGRFVETAAIEGLQVPSAVRSLIEARLADLDDGDRALLDLASVVGFAFDPDLVARVMDRPRIEVLQALARIERHTGIVRGGGGQHRFDHHQVQEILYGDMSEDLRREYHTALADAFAAGEGLAVEDAPPASGDAAFFLAFHHVRGRRPEAVRPVLDAAFTHLEGSFENEAAMDLALRALACKGLLEGAARVFTLLRLSRRYDLLGRAEEAQRTLDEALSATEQSPDPALRTRVHGRLGWHRWQRGDYVGAVAALEEARRLSREADSPRLEAQATGLLAVVYRAMGRLAESRAHNELCLTLCRQIGYDHGEAVATGNLSTVLWQQGYFDAALETCRRSLTLHRLHGDRFSEARHMGNEGLVLRSMGRYRAGRDLLEQSLTMTREIGDRQGEAIVLHGLCEAVRHLGHVSRALELGNAALRLAADIGARDIEVQARLALADLARWQEDPETAVAHFAKALDTLEPKSAAALHAEVLIEHARLLRETGAEDRARAVLEEGLGRAEAVDTPLQRALGNVLKAQLERTGARTVEHLVRELEERLPYGTRMEVHHRLWQLTGDRAHLDLCKKLLAQLKDEVAEGDRHTLVEGVPLHRAIEAAP